MIFVMRVECQYKKKTLELDASNAYLFHKSA
jgi:hypothetical protein